MAISLVLGKLSGATGSAMSVYKFVAGGELSRVLDTIGGVHFRSAKLSLEHVRIAYQRNAHEDAKREIDRAIDGFQDAYVSYTTKPGLLQRALNPYYEDKQVDNQRMACEAALFAALCYKLLGKQYMFDRYVGYARSAFEEYADNLILVAIGRIDEYAEDARRETSRERAELEDLIKTLECPWDLKALPWDR